MFKYTIIILLMGFTLVFSYCNPSKKATQSEEAIKIPKSTYSNSVETLIANNCSPCHIPAKNGNKKPLDNYVNVKTNIDEIIRRIDLNPTDKGFMPFKKSVKLNDSTINAFKQWRADGLIEN